MESEQLSIEQLNISFEDIDLRTHDKDVLSGMCQSFRTERVNEDTNQASARTDNGRRTALRIPKLLPRRSSGTSQSDTATVDPPFPNQERRFSLPKCKSPLSSSSKQRESRTSDSTIIADPPLPFKEENGGQTNIFHAEKGRESSLKHPALQSPRVEQGRALINKRLLSASETERASRTSYDSLEQTTSCSERGFANSETLPALDKARTRRMSPPLSPLSLTQKGSKYSCSKPSQIQAPDTLLPPTKKTSILCPSSSGETLSRGDAFMAVYPKKQEQGRRAFALDDAKTPLGTGLRGKLENEISLIRGQNPTDMKKSRYNPTTQVDGLSNERKQFTLEETSLHAPLSTGRPRRHVRSSNQTVRSTKSDRFDPMFE